MNKSKALFITLIFVLVGLPVIGYVLNWIYPATGIGDFLIWFPSLFWTLFKEFELEDIAKSVILYLIIAGVLIGLGFNISKRTENKIWLFVSLIMTIVAIITGNIL